MNDTIGQGIDTMTLTINLTPAEEEQLRVRASETGPDADAFIANLVRQSLPQHIDDDENEMPTPGESLYDALKDFIGVVDSNGQFNFSERTGEAFTEILLEKKAQGKI